MRELGEVIAARLVEWGIDDLPLERELFGSAAPDVIAIAVDDWCCVHLGAAIDHYEFFESSSGSVHGVRLSDGRAVVVKGHRPAVSRSYLDAATAVQRELADTGFPAPRPLVAPTPVGPGHLTAEETLRATRDADPHDPAVRHVLAEGLARFVEVAGAHRAAFDATSHPMAVPDGALYPVPHSTRFDFEVTSEGAEWIDRLALEARMHLRSTSGGSPVVIHGDWRFENVCVSGGRLVAVYDWDSVHVQHEPIALAPAVTTFSVDWNRSEGRRFPDAGEMTAFIDEYERARGTPFTRTERDVVAAAMVASLAYGARCEHADPGSPPDGDDSQRGLLARLGTRLLAEGLDALR